MGICFEYIALRFKYSSNAIGSILHLGCRGCRFESCLLYALIKIRCSPQYKRVGDVTFKTYKVWNEWQLHTGELIAYTLAWGK